MKEHLNHLLNQPMDRAKFLKMAGVALLAAVGVQRLLAAILRSDAPPEAPSNVQPQAGPYGR